MHRMSPQESLVWGNKRKRKWSSGRWKVTSAVRPVGISPEHGVSKCFQGSVTEITSYLTPEGQLGP